MYDNKFHEYRADFLVASDLALRAQLTEFRDHQLVNYLTVSKRNGKVRFRILLVFWLKHFCILFSLFYSKVLSKRGSVDGGEYLTIPLDRSQIFLRLCYPLLCVYQLMYCAYRATLQAFLENIEESWRRHISGNFEDTIIVSQVLKTISVRK